MNPKKSDSYLWVEDFSTNEILKLFSRAEQIKNTLLKGEKINTLLGHQVALLFSEASTRTKISFQIAAQRLGAQCLVIDDVNSTSMSKGETFSDTFWTIHSMRPSLFIIRCGDDDGLDHLAQKSQTPIINAGFGSKSHPTQALLDGFTLLERFGSLKDLKILFVGDIDHSRVAASDFALFRALGAEVGVCAPEHFRQKKLSSIKVFTELNEAIPWCDVYVGLRVQFERHGGETLSQITKDDFQKNYSLDKEGLKLLKKESVIMHPGPVNWGVEFQDCVKEDSRLLMWKQKENGVYTRAALMEKVLQVNL